MTEIVNVEQGGALPVVQPAAGATPADMVLYVMQKGGSIDQLEKFMELQRKWEADQARKAFVAAKAAFKAENIVVTKDKENLQYKSRYSSLGNLVNTVAPFLSKHGLSADWDVDQTEGLAVTCILSHSLGHSERVTMKVPPDTAGAKNQIQQIKSAITYAKAVTFESVCGLAATDANLDDDGHGYGLNTALADKWIAEVRQAKDEPAMLAVWNKALVEIRAADDGFAYDEVKRVYVERRNEIKGGTQ